MTDRFVASAKPEQADRGTRVEYFDSAAKGLSLRVSDGAKSWAFHYTRAGRRARLTLGTYPAMTLAQARAAAVEARGNLQRGEDPRAVFASQRDHAATVETLIARYLEIHVRPNLRSAAAVERRFHRNIAPVIGRVRLTDLHKRDVNRAVDAVMSRGRPTEANRVFEDIRAVLRWAVKRGDLDRNPIDGMAKPAAGRVRERVLGDDEIRVLWSGLPTSLARSRSCQRIIKLCLVTAQRVGEVAGMRRDELDMRAALWTLPPSRTKNKSAHTVPLSDLALAIIQDAIADAPDSLFVFPAASGSLSGAAVARTIALAHQVSKERPHGRFGIPRWSAHDLRRTALTNMAKLGIAPIVLGHVANHLTTTKAGITLAVYTRHQYDREKCAALNLWADRLAAIVGGVPAAVVLPMARA